MQATIAAVRAELAVRQARVPLAEVKRRALARPSALDGVSALCGEGIAVIADVDASCPDKAALALQYEQGGACLVGIPAGPHRRAGAPDELAEARVRVQIPVLCTDLVISSYQLWDARAHGADLVLLTAAALEQEALVSLIERAASIGLGAMVEVRDGRELVRAVGAGARIISLSPREPDSHEVDRDALAHLLPLVPDGVVRVAACGSAGRADLIACARNGADAVRIGTPLPGDGDPRAAVAALVAIGAHPALARRRHQAV